MLASELAEWTLFASFLTGLLSFDLSLLFAEVTLLSFLAGALAFFSAAGFLFFSSEFGGVGIRVCNSKLREVKKRFMVSMCFVFML